jgi:hypothetical protein
MTGLLPAISRNDTVLMVRSAHIGDFIVCIPFIQHLVEEIGVPTENIRFLIINDSGADPVSMIFGPTCFSQDAVYIVNNSPWEAIASVPAIRRQFGRIDHVLYLPFTDEPRISFFKKQLLLKYIFGFGREIHGMASLPPGSSKSQYLSLFDRYGLSYQCVDYIQFLGIETKLSVIKIDKLLANSTPLRIAIYPNSKLAMKIWPRENYIDLIKRILERYKCSIFLVGGKEDVEYNETITREFSENEVKNVAGSLSVRETILFLSRASALIGNDGAPLHMAALANTPIVGLFSYKAPVGMWDPLIVDRLATLRMDVDCKDCGKVYCEDPKCIKAISIAHVLDKLVELISSSGSLRHLLTIRS